MDSIKLVPRRMSGTYAFIVHSFYITQDDPVSYQQQINQTAALYDITTLVGKGAQAGLFHSK